MHFTVVKSLLKFYNTSHVFHSFKKRKKVILEPLQYKIQTIAAAFLEFTLEPRKLILAKYDDKKLLSFWGCRPRPRYSTL